MIQRKTNVIFFEKKYRSSKKPPIIAEASVLTKKIDITSNDIRILQFYSVNNLVPRHKNEWHYWHIQSTHRRIIIPSTYLESLLCYDIENGNFINCVPKRKRLIKLEQTKSKEFQQATTDSSFFLEFLWNNST